MNSDDPSYTAGNRWAQLTYPGGSGTYPGSRQHVTVTKVEYSSGQEQGQGYRQGQNYGQSCGELSSQPVYRDELIRTHSDMTVNQGPQMKINPHFSVSITPSPSSFSSIVATKLRSPPTAIVQGRLNPGFRIDAEPRELGVSGDMGNSREATSRGYGLVSGAPITVQHINSTSINRNGSFPERGPFNRLPEAAPRRILYSSQSGEQGIAMSRPFIQDAQGIPSLHLSESSQRTIRPYSENYRADSLTTNDGRGSHSPSILRPNSVGGTDSLQFGLRQAPPGTSGTGSLLASLQFGQPKSGTIHSSQFDGRHGLLESQTGRKHEIEAEVDALTDILMENMSVAGNQDFYGMNN